MRGAEAAKLILTPLHIFLANRCQMVRGQFLTWLSRQGDPTHAPPHMC